MEMYKYTSEVSVKDDIISLSRYFRNQLNKLNEVSGDDKYSIDKIAQNLEISGDMLQKKLNGSKPLSREWLIAICAAFGLGGCETNKLLNFAGYSQLDWNVPLECILLCYINEKKNKGKPHSLKEINDYLTDNGCERICVKFRRNQISPRSTLPMYAGCSSELNASSSWLSFCSVRNLRIRSPVMLDMVSRFSFIVLLFSTLKVVFTSFSL